MSFPKSLKIRHAKPANLKLRPAAPQDGSPKAPKAYLSSAIAHVRASTSNATALKNIKDELPTNYSRNIGDWTPLAPRASADVPSGLDALSAENTAGEPPAAPSNGQRMSSQLGMGAMPERIEDAISSVAVAVTLGDIGPTGTESLVGGDINFIKDVYLQGANLELRPGNFPRFIGKSIPAPDGEKVMLGEGVFNQVELVRIIDPGTKQERNFAFKPSKPNPSIGRSGQLTGIAKDGFAPENRNLAAVAVARTLGLLGEDGVTGDAFMGIVDGRLGLLMEVAPGRPMAKPSRDIRVDPRSSDYARLTKPSLKRQIISSPAVNLAQSNLLGVHSIRYEGNNVILTGSITDPNHPDDLEPFRNNDPSLKKAYSIVEIFHQLINEPDGHPGNLLVEKKADGGYAIRAIDLDQAFGSRSNIVLAPEISYMAYFLPVRARYIGKELADKMSLPATRDAMALAVSTHLASQPEVDACMKRFDLIVESITKGYITVIDDSGSNEVWRNVEMTNPRASLFARDGRRHIPANTPNQQ